MTKDVIQTARFVPQFDYDYGDLGVQSFYQFPNGYGASVVNHKGSYGTELAVIKIDRETGKWKIVYDTGVTSDVEGYIGTRRLQELLDQISALPDNRTIWQKFTDYLGFTPAPLDTGLRKG